MGFGAGEGLRVKLLVVEDEPLIRLDLVQILEEAGFEVFSAGNADSAMPILLSECIDLVLTDIDMPGSMDGLRLASAVRDRWPPVQIVVMSGKKEPLTSEMPPGARFIGKPFGTNKLLQAVDFG